MSIVECPRCRNLAQQRTCVWCGPGHAAGGPATACLVCQGKGVEIRCATCDAARIRPLVDAAQLAQDREALRRNPFLRYYDKRFARYRK